MTNSDIAKALTQRIKEQVERAAGRGLKAAGIFLIARVREAISVPAVPGTKAVPNAPIRRVTGAVQRGLFFDTLTLPNGDVALRVGDTARSAKGFLYANYHEVKNGGQSGMHPFVLPTALKYKRELAKILGKEVVVEFNQ